MEVSTKAVHDTVIEVPESKFTFQLTNPGGGFLGRGLKPWDQRKRTTTQGASRDPAADLGHPRDRGFRRYPALPEAACSPWSSSLPPPPRRGRSSSLPSSFKSGGGERQVLVPSADRREDRPAAIELDIDLQKVAQLNLNLQQVGQDLGAAAGGNFVNRFSISGRSYKVIPHAARTERLNPEQPRTCT